ncbi:hypothetical protein MLD52_13940 [Puniceicoccaceae bacterium K14]|nr:hypothetical protein [Puniceicoccaceae bacterium K14]
MHSHHSYIGFSPARNISIIIALILVVCSCLADPISEATSDDDLDMYFMKVIELDPIVVKSEEFSISIFAEKNATESYAERFSHSVVEVAYGTLEKSTGQGLVIAGEKNNPHPFIVIHTFLDLDENGLIQEELSPTAEQLRVLLKKWEELTQSDDPENDPENEDVLIGFEDIANAFPVPLEGVASDLYLATWTENTMKDQLKDRLKNLTLADLTKYKQDKYDWVFYLPPRSSVNKALKKVIPMAMKEAKLGFFKRTAARAAIATFKPIIKDAAEGLRKGMLYYTVLNAMGQNFNDGDIEALTKAYVEALMPRGKILGSDKKQRALEAAKKQKIKNIEYAKDPFVPPNRLQEFDPASFAKFEGKYGKDAKKSFCSFVFENDAFTWKKNEKDKKIFYPASEFLFVSEDSKMTIEFQTNIEGQVTSVEERWVRDRRTLPKI